MFQHILFPTDGSDQSNAAFKVAVDLRRKYGGRITLLRVHEEFLNEDEMQYLRVSPAHYKEFMRHKALNSRALMEKLVADAGEQGNCDVLLREGRPRREIIQISKEIKVDLIVMMSNGRSNLKEQVVGSVAEYVVRNSDIPVMVVKG